MASLHPVFQTPEIDDVELRVVAAIDELRSQLRRQVAEPRRWAGSLRRMALARAVQGSNSIEGYNATLDDVLAAVEGDETLDATEETQLALSGYRDAMTYVLQLAQDDETALDASLLKSLHFMMLKYDLRKNPGLWRPGPIWVRRDDTGEIVYEGPPSELVPGLVATMVDDLQEDQSPVLIRAAMAHLNLVMIHPFSDGNGRMGRALQTLVLARDRILAPSFSSIEEYLGRNTPAYYDILALVGQGAWNPQRDARPWVRFCLTAHYRQAKTILRRVRSTEQLWLACLDITEDKGLPERVVAPLMDAAQGLRLRNATYRRLLQVTEGDEISDLTASRDLRALVDSGLLEPIGQNRGRHYVGTEGIRRVWHRIREQYPPRVDEDPFEAVMAGQLELVDRP